MTASGHHSADGETDDPLVGTELGDYRIDSRLGQGGMGAVYRSHDLVLDRTVALKVMLAHLAGDREGRARFQREIRHAAAIEHPNVVPVYNAGFEGGHFFIAMRLIDGPDLADVLRSGPVSPSRALKVFGEIASALERVHREGLIHRDVKPANILISEAGTRHEYALLGDFGISKALDGVTSLTRGVVGTAEYSPPEILRWMPAVPQSDQYSLACVLFEMLAGRSPYEGRDLPAAHLDEPIPEPPNAAGDETATALRRALSKEPNRRFATIGDFVSACTAGSVEARQSRAGTPNDAVAPNDASAGRSTLQDELVAILTEARNEWRTAKQLAQRVTLRGVYRKRDGSPVTGSHVQARAREHASLFESNGARIRLRDDPEN